MKKKKPLQNSFAKWSVLQNSLWGVSFILQYLGGSLCKIIWKVFFLNFYSLCIFGSQGYTPENRLLSFFVLFFGKDEEKPPKNKVSWGLLNPKNSKNKESLAVTSTSRPWRNLPPTWVMHIATRRLGASLNKTIQGIYVDRRVVWLVCGSPCGSPMSEALFRHGQPFANIFSQPFLPTPPQRAQPPLTPKSLEKKGKSLKKTRNFPQGKKQGIPKEARKGRRLAWILVIICRRHMQ